MNKQQNAEKPSFALIKYLPLTLYNLNVIMFTNTVYILNRYRYLAKVYLCQHRYFKTFEKERSTLLFKSPIQKNYQTNYYYSY